MAVLSDKIIKFLNLEGLVKSLSEYVETRLEIAKVEAKEEISSGLSQLAVFAVIALVLGTGMLFLSLALALLLTLWLEPWLAFLVVGFLYLTLGLVGWIFRDPLMTRLEVKLKRKFKLIK